MFYLFLSIKIDCKLEQKENLATNHRTKLQIKTLMSNPIEKLKCQT